jgi:hypothetical protein
LHERQAFEEQDWEDTGHEIKDEAAQKREAYDARKAG